MTPFILVPSTLDSNISIGIALAKAKVNTILKPWDYIEQSHSIFVQITLVDILFFNVIG